MKKTLLLLSLALFIAAGVVTISKVKHVNAANSNTELAFTGDNDESSFMYAPQDGDKTKKDDKSKVKAGKTDCSKSCGSKSKGGEAKCAEAKCDKSKCTDAHKTEGGKSCCASKEKSTEKDKK